MATSTPEHPHALHTLRPLVEKLGFAHVLYLLAELADEQRDAATRAADATGTMRAAHDGRILGEAAKRLLS